MIISASTARAKLFPLIEQVNQDQAPVIITSNAGNAVLVSESEWESILETAFILRTKSNRTHIENAITELEAGLGDSFTYKKGETLERLLELVGVEPSNKIMKRESKMSRPKTKSQTIKKVLIK